MPGPRRNVVLILSDQLRADCVGCYGNETIRTPHIDALAAVLDSGHLAGAGLDVFAEEPFASDHPIKACEQVVLTPHAADQTPEGIDLLNEGAVDNVIAFLEGNPRNNVAV